MCCCCLPQTGVSPAGLPSTLPFLCPRLVSLSPGVEETHFLGSKGLLALGLLPVQVPSWCPVRIGHRLACSALLVCFNCCIQLDGVTAISSHKFWNFPILSLSPTPNCCEPKLMATLYKTRGHWWPSNCPTKSGCPGTR